MGNHAAYFPIHVLVKALTGASNRHESRECAAQFLSRCGVFSLQQRRQEGFVIVVDIKRLYPVATFICVVIMPAILSAQSVEQKKMQRLYPVQFDVKLVANDGYKRNLENRQLEANLGSYDKVQVKLMVYSARLRSYLKRAEEFSIESIWMTNRGIPCARDEYPITLFSGVATNIVIASPAVTSRDTHKVTITGKWVNQDGVVTGYDYKVSDSKSGTRLLGAIIRLKKNGVVIRTWCQINTWRKIAWTTDFKVTGILNAEVK